MCHVDEFELEELREPETRSNQKEFAIIKTETKTSENKSKEENRREFDSEVPVTI